MSKETAVGLTIILGLFTTLGVVVVKRVTQEDNSPIMGVTTWSKGHNSVLHGAPQKPGEDREPVQQVAQRSSVRPASSYDAVADAAAETDASDPLATNAGRSGYPSAPADTGEPSTLTVEPDAQPLRPSTEVFSSEPINSARIQVEVDPPAEPAPLPQQSRVEPSVLRESPNRRQTNPIRHAPAADFQGEIPAEYESRSGARLAPDKFQSENERPATTWRHDVGEETSLARPAEHQQSLRDTWDDRPARGANRGFDEQRDTRNSAPSRSELPPGNQYKVQPNDTYWNISEKVYGNAGYYKALHAYNKKLRPALNQLDVGQTISVPEYSELERLYPDLCPRHRATGNQVAGGVGRARGGRVYVVEKGDNLFDIARQELGKASRWAEIYDLNREALGEDYDYLRPGLELTLPDGSATAGRSGFSHNR